MLHDRGPAPREGIDAGRLERLADLIEGLEVMDRKQRDWAAGPVDRATRVDGRSPVLGYLLDAGGDGFGDVCFPGKGETAYYLTGYGLVCWGWGMAAGITSVAANGHANAVQDVLTAEPVRRGEIPDLALAEVTGRHVADAIRQFIEHRDAQQAWWLASGLKPEAQAPAARPAQAPAPKVVALKGAAALTGAERWKALVLAEDVEGLRALCTGQVARLEGELETWRRRLKAAEALAGEDG